MAAMGFVAASLLSKAHFLTSVEESDTEEKHSSCKSQSDGFFESFERPRVILICSRPVSRYRWSQEGHDRQAESRHSQLETETQTSRSGFLELISWTETLKDSIYILSSTVNRYRYAERNKAQSTKKFEVRK